jgi:type III secretory pathway component EscV
MTDFLIAALNKKYLGSKRELLLVAGVILITLGLLGVGLPLIYSVIISVAIYAGIKLYVEKYKKSIKKEVGQGLCMECGSKVVDGMCPNCDSKID